MNEAKARAEALAIEFFRCMYGEHAIVPKEPLSELPAYPCWALACHAFEKLLGIDPRSDQEPQRWTTPNGDFSVLGDKTIHLPAGHVNGQQAWSPPQPWQDHVMDNARRIESECK